MNLAIFRKLRGMDGPELRFRTRTAIRTRVDRARVTLGAPGWKRERLRLRADVVPADARAALERADWMAAHRLLARHFVRRPVRFPLAPVDVPAIASRVRAAFPGADTAPADRILAGRYDVLGYRDLAPGEPPDWHRDPVHGRGAPRAFWDAVPYLDPGCGDHKITWELNRHQHFLALGRAHALTGDRRYYAVFVRHLSDWIAHNPPLLGTNWASMLELAFRSLSWIWGLHFFADAASDDDAQPWVVDLLLALDRQLHHVEQNLSRYFSPNTHLTGEALALYVAGRALPELDAAEHRATVGGDVLIEEGVRQVLPDGGHAELSTHYHRYSTDFYLLALQIARLTNDGRAADFEEAARRQARYLRVIADDRGQLPLIGDDDGGQLFPICRRPPADVRDTLATAAVLLSDPGLAAGPVPEEALWRCGSGTPVDPGFVAAPVGSMLLADSGYAVSRTPRGDHLVFDVGRHGYLNGGHAHADALGVVLTVAGRPLLVDPGTATYTMDPVLRDRFRSAAMHNTVLVNGRSPSAPDGPFRWRSRTDARCTRWQVSPEGDEFEAEHRGFAPLVHTRRVTAMHGRGWIIEDRLLGSGHVQAAALWHIHPEWTLDSLDGTQAHLRHTDGTTTILLSSIPLAPADPDLALFAPEYGRVIRGVCLTASVAGAAPVAIRTVIPADGTLERALELASSVHSG